MPSLVSQLFDQVSPYDVVRISKLLYVKRVFDVAEDIGTKFKMATDVNLDL